MLLEAEIRYTHLRSEDKSATLLSPSYAPLESLAVLRVCDLEGNPIHALERTKDNEQIGIAQWKSS